jgi:hypothetical protein
MDEATFSHRNGAHWVDGQLERASTRGAEPEELGVDGSPFKRIKIATIQKLELFAAA